LAVKGSQFKPMKLVPHKPVARFFRMLGVLVAFLIGLPLSYHLGQTDLLQEQADQQQGVFVEKDSQIANLQTELAKLKTSQDIDRQSMEELRQTVVAQKAQIAASERDVRVYKDLLSPGAKTNPAGISFGAFILSPIKGAENRYSYKLTIQKLSLKESDFTGFLEFKILGQQAGKQVILSLYQVSSQVTAAAIPLSLKYFQTLEGEIKLPADYLPQNIELSVKPQDKKAANVAQIQFSWPANSKSQ